MVHMMKSYKDLRLSPIYLQQPVESKSLVLKQTKITAFLSKSKHAALEQEQLLANPKVLCQSPIVSINPELRTPKHSKDKFHSEVSRFSTDLLIEGEYLVAFEYWGPPQVPS